ncbi:CRAL/TRIO [Leishmania braziliensis MHOM/BR/75/M2904]|uniref:CRAL/TRIO n=1 Tax=Leishmania braziliensis MHOM/BR/75/M2904 TaxID=420245 RepID=A0A3P3ZHF4_LEIBR|nr:CRAL/TRIO [Leishmania braziliensis MHOM/BR/75/M2904]
MSSKSDLALAAKPASTPSNGESAASTVEADLDLPKDCFLLPKQNDGFQIPYFLSSEEEVNKIRPPTVVKTWEQRRGELEEAQQRKLEAFIKMVSAAPWYAAEKFDNWLCLRYLLARSFDLDKAFSMLEGWVPGARRARHTPGGGTPRHATGCRGGGKRGGAACACQRTGAWQDCVLKGKWFFFHEFLICQEVQMSYHLNNFIWLYSFVFHEEVKKCEFIMRK